MAEQRKILSFGQIKQGVEAEARAIYVQHGGEAQRWGGTKCSRWYRCGEAKRVQYPVFSGYAAVLDAEGREIFRHEVLPGSLKLDARMLHKAGDDLAYKLSKSLSARFCLKISEPFGGL